MWIVAQEGAREHYAVPLAFHRLGLLDCFLTDVWASKARGLLRRGSFGMRALAGRYHPDLADSKVIAFGWSAIAKKARQHFLSRPRNVEELGHGWVDYGRWFARKVVRELSGGEISLEQRRFFGFDTTSLEVLEYLRGKQVLTVLDQIDPGRVEEDMVLEECARWPGWQQLPGRLPEAYWQRLEEEWRAAHFVLVNSEWTKKALLLQGVPGAKIIIVPLAIDADSVEVQPRSGSKGALRVLWVGAVILRKGIQYLIEAARMLSATSIEFIVAGPIGISQSAVASAPANVKFLGRIPRVSLAEIYVQADVFVLPTISDGFAITQLEAMAHGLPVIATPNCGAVVRDGLDGFVVRARDAQALASAIAKLDADRRLLRDMAASAVIRSRDFDLLTNARKIIHSVDEASDLSSRSTSDRLPAKQT